MAIWKCEAEDDTVYVEANDASGAHAALTSKLGPIPRDLVKYTEVAELPKDEVLL